MLTQDTNARAQSVQHTHTRSRAVVIVVAGGGTDVVCFSGVLHKQHVADLQ